MPTYEYRCQACGHELEIFQGITEAPRRKCPACGKLRLKRGIGGGAGLIFKGSGFYLTDYRSEAYKKAAAAEKGATEKGAESGAKPEKPAAGKDAAAGKKEPGSGAKGGKRKGGGSAPASGGSSGE